MSAASIEIFPACKTLRPKPFNPLETMRPEGVALYRPSVFYFRHHFRSVYSVESLSSLALHLVLELESLQEFIRTEGLIPPERHVAMTYVAANGLVAEGDEPEEEIEKIPLRSIDA